MVFTRMGIVATIVVLMGIPACAGDWPQFRGPTGQGISTETGLPVQWSTNRNVQWQTEVPGKGWSSPVVCDGRVFLTTAVPVTGGHPRDRSLRAVCLDADSGEILWNVEVFAQDGRTTQGEFHSKNSHASPTPVIDGERLFVHFGAQGTACLTTDGNVVWKTRKLEYNMRHGNGGSPVLVDGLLIFSCDGFDVQFVAALDADSGEIRWKTTRPPVPNPSKFSFSTPLVIEVRSQKQVLSAGTDQLIAYEPQTGREIWRVRYDGYSVVPRPVFGDGLVFISTSWSHPTVLAIRPDGRGDVTETHVAWRRDRSAPHTSSTLLVGDELYFVSDDGIASCLDAETGRVHWMKRIGGNYSASPTFADGKIYFQSEQGNTVVIRTGTRYDELGRNQLGERTLASFAVADSALFIRTESHVYRIEKP